MSSEKISLIILLFSFLGMAVLCSRKISALSILPAESQGLSGKELVSGIKSRIKTVPGLRSFSFEILLQKIISQIRILSLKTDHQTFAWLQKLREKNQQKKRLQDDNYWEELKKTTTEPKK